MTGCFSRHDKLSHYSDSLVSDEMKIVRWIRMMRVTELAMKRLFSKDQLDEMIEESMYRYIELNHSSDMPKEMTAKYLILN